MKKSHKILFDLLSSKRKELAKNVVFMHDYIRNLVNDKVTTETIDKSTLWNFEGEFHKVDKEISNILIAIQEDLDGK